MFQSVGMFSSSTGMFWNLPTDPIPTMTLNFTTGTLDPRVTFTRSQGTTTAASYYNSSGVLSYATANTPRFDYDPIALTPKGLLIEETRTNLCLQSGFQASWSTSICTLTNNTTTSPDGTNTGSTLTAGSGTASLFTASSIAVTINTNYTLSFHFKRGTGTWVLLNIWAGSANNGVSLWINTATGALGTSSATTGYSVTSSSITNVGNGWYRATLTGQSSSATAVYANIRHVDGDGAFTFATTNGLYSYIWGAQFEAGAFATSYIPTTTTSVQRGADNASMTGTNFSSWWNASQGTIVVTTTSYASANLQALGIFGASSGAAANSVSIYQYLSGSNGPRMETLVGGATVNATVIAKGATGRKFAYSYGSGTQYNAYCDGTTNTPSISTNTQSSGCNQAFIGSVYLAAGYPLNGTIASVSYYPTALPASKLKGLTS